MSMADLKKFIQLVKTDAAIAKKVAEIGRRNFTGLIVLGKELKLDFDEKDFETLQKEAKGSPKELSDAELGDVSGGVPTPWEFW